MKWRLNAEHHIDEQVLPAGTEIGDGTQWPYRSTYDDPKINRKIGDALPPSNEMIPLDEEAHKLFKSTYGEEAPDKDPFRSVPLSGAPGAPMVRGVATQAPRPTEPTPRYEPPPAVAKVGLNAEPPKPSPAAVLLKKD